MFDGDRAMGARDLPTLALPEESFGFFCVLTALSDSPYAEINPLQSDWLEKNEVFRPEEGVTLIIPLSVF